MGVSMDGSVIRSPDGLMVRWIHSTYCIYVYMVKDHSDSKRDNMLPLHSVLFLINSKESIPVVEHWAEWQVDRVNKR